MDKIHRDRLYKKLRNKDNDFKERNDIFKRLYSCLDVEQCVFLVYLAEKNKSEAETLKWIEEYNDIDFGENEIYLVIDMVKFKREELLKELPKKMKSEAKQNLISRLRNS